MLILAGLAVLVLVLIILFLAGYQSFVNGPEEKAVGPSSTYEAVPAFLSAAERSFFGVLRQSLKEEYYIFPKVRLADIARPARNPSRSGWQSAFNRICGKHVDFVLCDPASLHIVAIVELDDRSHERFDRGFRDSFVDSVLSDAHIPVLRIPARQSYSPVQIREQVHNLFTDTVKPTLAVVR
jgi:hypothetical protein